ncbi:MAG: hypothetical protein NUW37_10500 [Planctomycetes bacterium]|nr:hypothetical protein [Planctomycetota bacterium]
MKSLGIVISILAISFAVSPSLVAQQAGTDSETHEDHTGHDHAASGKVELQNPDLMQDPIFYDFQCLCTCSPVGSCPHYCTARDTVKYAVTFLRGKSYDDDQVKHAIEFGLDSESAPEVDAWLAKYNIRGDTNEMEVRRGLLGGFGATIVIRDTPASTVVMIAVVALGLVLTGVFFVYKMLVKPAQVIAHDVEPHSSAKPAQDKSRVDDIIDAALKKME